MKLHPSLTLDRVLAAAEEQMFGMTNPGFCIGCGEEAEGVEPDAEGYPCEACGARKVMGAEQLMFHVVA